MLSSFLFSRVGKISTEETQVGLGLKSTLKLLTQLDYRHYI